MQEQLPLSVSLREDATLENFYTARNSQALAWIHDLSAHAEEPCLFIWGVSGVGKSHLLQAACHHIHESGQTAVYLPLSQPGLSPKVLEGLESLALVCLDDIQAIAGHREWEEAIFHLFNRLLAIKSHALLIASNKPVKQLDIKLKDLHSRLSWGINYQIHPLTEAELLTAFQGKAAALGLEITDDAGKFLLRRTQRSLLALNQLLKQLDKASLIAQHKLTIPFIKKILRI